MYILNYLYFAILTVIGFSWLTAKGRYMKHPLDRNKKMWFDGPESFWVLTFATGLLAFSAPGGTFNILSIRLFVLEAFCIIGSILAKQKPVWNAAAERRSAMRETVYDLLNDMDHQPGC